uniref:Uncharacterized protein n=1 Tax=Aplanochytrium stocchinoi TaxID=215587 RepID=A0A7S3V0K1_9STRA
MGLLNCNRKLSQRLIVVKISNRNSSLQRQDFALFLSQANNFSKSSPSVIPSSTELQITTHAVLCALFRSIRTENSNGLNTQQNIIMQKQKLDKFHEHLLKFVVE